MKKLSIGLLALLIIGIVGAVYYLSNSVEVNVNVEKPMSMNMVVNNILYNELNLNMTAGESLHFVLNTSVFNTIPLNQSNQVVTITNPSGLNCDHISYFVIQNVGNLSTMCIANANGANEIDYVLPSKEWTTNQLDNVDLTFALFAEGNYSIVFDVQYND